MNKLTGVKRLIGPVVVLLGGLCMVLLGAPPLALILTFGCLALAYQLADISAAGALTQLFMAGKLFGHMLSGDVSAAMATGIAAGLLHVVTALFYAGRVVYDARRTGMPGDSARADGVFNRLAVSDSAEPDFSKMTNQELGSFILHGQPGAASRAAVYELTQRNYRLKAEIRAILGGLKETLPAAAPDDDECPPATPVMKDWED